MKCTDKSEFRAHLEKHPDFLHGPVTREGYLCTACPKAYQKDSRGTNDAAIHQAGHERAGVDNGLIMTYIDFYWLGTPGQGRYHFYGLRSSKPRVKGEWYQSLATPKRKKSEALVADSPPSPKKKKIEVVMGKGKGSGMTTGGIPQKIGKDKTPSTHKGPPLALP